jgi:hypothetical protein
MSRAARITLAASAVFAVSGALSGLLIDEYGGAVGVLEWILRTLVVLSAAVALSAGLVLVLRLRRGSGPRPLRWLLTAVATLGFLFVVVQPSVFAVYLTHLPARKAVHDVPLGAAKQPVTLTTSGGLRLSGWYVPSRNGAAVAVMHGTGSTRSGSPATRGCSPARLRRPALRSPRPRQERGPLDEPAVELPAGRRRRPGLPARRPDVRGGRIGLVGVSLGGEVAIHAAARRPQWRATVLEGVQGGSPADMRASKPDPASYVALTTLYGLGRVLGGSGPARAQRRPGRAHRPRPLLLLSAGRGTEARANEEYRRRAAGPRSCGTSPRPRTPPHCGRIPWATSGGSSVPGPVAAPVRS